MQAGCCIRATRRARPAGAGVRGWAVVAVACVLTSGLAAESGQAGAAIAAVEPIALEAPESVAPGAVLRAARSAAAAGELDIAVGLLDRLAAGTPLIADHADLLQMRVLLEGERYADAVSFRQRWQHDGSPLQGSFLALLGEAYAGRGDAGVARRVWSDAYDATEPADARAGLKWRIGESYEESGELAAAARHYQVVWTVYPWTDEAVQAEAALARLALELGDAVRPSGHDHRKRGDSFYRKRRNEDALLEYDRALAEGDLARRDDLAALRGRADTLFRLRRYSEATLAYDAIPQDDEIRIAAARALTRSGDVMAGARRLEAIGKNHRSRHSPRANLLAALLLDGEGDTENALRLYRVVSQQSNASYATKALWRLGWAAYLEGQDEMAIAYFDRLRRRDADPISRLRPRYWAARARERLGDPAGVADLQQMGAEYPLSYYGWRAAGHLARSARQPVERVARSAVPVPAGTSRIGDEEIRRAVILLEAGMRPEALEELRRLFVRARGLSDRVGLAELFSDAGDFHSAQRLIVDAYNEVLARGPDPDQIDMWWFAWPAPFRNYVLEATDAAPGLAPGLVYAIMREESGYRPEVLSVSGARGLLQLMPSTAEVLHTGLDREGFDPDDLFLPEVNIELGSVYLAELLDRFDGRASAAIASYNAGPEAVSRWLTGNPRDDDEWVEAIPYDQTRRYVKRVLRSVEAYRVLY